MSLSRYSAVRAANTVAGRRSRHGATRALRVSGGSATGVDDPLADIDAWIALLAANYKLFNDRFNAIYVPLVVEAVPPQGSQFYSRLLSDGNPIEVDFPFCVAFYGDVDFDVKTDAGTASYEITADIARAYLDVAPGYTVGQSFENEPFVHDVKTTGKGRYDFTVVAVQPKKVYHYRFREDTFAYELDHTTIYSASHLHDTSYVKLRGEVPLLNLIVADKFCSLEGVDESGPATLKSFAAFCMANGLRIVRRDIENAAIGYAAKIIPSSWSQQPLAVRDRMADLFLLREVHRLNRAAITLELMEVLGAETDAQLMPATAFEGSTFGDLHFSEWVRPPATAPARPPLTGQARTATFTFQQEQHVVRIEHTIQAVNVRADLYLTKVDYDLLRAETVIKGHFKDVIKVTYSTPCAPIPIGHAEPAAFHLNDREGGSRFVSSEGRFSLNGSSATAEYTAEQIFESEFRYDEKHAFKEGDSKMWYNGFIIDVNFRVGVFTVRGFEEASRPVTEDFAGPMFSSGLPNIRMFAVPVRFLENVEVNSVRGDTERMALLATAMQTIELTADFNQLEAQMEYMRGLYRVNFLGGVGMAFFAMQPFIRTFKWQVVTSGLGLGFTVADDALKGHYGAAVAEAMGVILPVAAHRWRTRRTVYDVTPEESIIRTFANITRNKLRLRDHVAGLGRDPFEVRPRGIYGRHNADTDFISLNASRIGNTRISAAAHEYASTSNDPAALALREMRLSPEHHFMTVNSNILTKEGTHLNLVMNVGIADGAAPHNGNLQIGSVGLYGVEATPGLHFSLTKRADDGGYTQVTLNDVSDPEDMLLERKALMAMCGHDPNQLRDMSLLDTLALDARSVAELAAHNALSIRARECIEVETKSQYFDPRELPSFVSQIYSTTYGQGFMYNLLHNNCQHYIRDVFRATTVPGEYQVQSARMVLSRGFDAAFDDFSDGMIDDLLLRTYRAIMFGEVRA